MVCKRFLGRTRHIEGIRLRLLDHADADRGRAVESNEFAIILRAYFCMADVLQSDRIAVPGRNDDLIELIGRP